MTDSKAFAESQTLSLGSDDEEMLHTHKHTVLTLAVGGQN